MTAAQKQPKWSVEEFLAWHERQEEKYEMVNGVPVLQWPPVPVTLPGATAPTMMTGASRRYNQINGNLYSGIKRQLVGSGCKAITCGAGVRTAANQLRYPDVVVDCGTPLDEGYVFEHPRLVAEVLSPSARSFDLARNVTEYWQIDGMVYILIVDPERRRAQLHIRQAGESPRLHVFEEPGDTIDLPEIGVALRLADIFEGLPPAREAGE